MLGCRSYSHDLLVLLIFNHFIYRTVAYFLAIGERVRVSKTNDFTVRQLHSCVSAVSEIVC